MLESSSRADKGSSSFPREADAEQCASHASIRTTRAAPESIACIQQLLRRRIIQAIGVEPDWLGMDPESARRMRDRILRCDVILVGGTEICNDADANRLLHTVIIT